MRGSLTERRDVFAAFAVRVRLVRGQQRGAPIGTALDRNRCECRSIVAIARHHVPDRRR